MTSFLSYVDAVEHFNKHNALDELADAYENNDMEHNIYLLARDMCNERGCPFMDYFIDIVSTSRTINFANEIMSLLQNTEEPITFFMAVGLAHVMGSGMGEEFTDIIQQLELAGIYATPLW